MTTVYGVTFIGAREQIEKQLKDRVDMPAEETWIAAAYLAKAVSLTNSNEDSNMSHCSPARFSRALVICSVAPSTFRTGSTCQRSLLRSQSHQTVSTKR